MGIDLLSLMGSHTTNTDNLSNFAVLAKHGVIGLPLQSQLLFCFTF